MANENVVTRKQYLDKEGLKTVFEIICDNHYSKDEIDGLLENLGFEGGKSIGDILKDYLKSADAEETYEKKGTAYSKAEADGKYLTKEDAEKTYLKEHQSLEDYAKKTEVTKEIGEAVADMATMSWVTEQEYLTEADLDGYATQSWVQDQEYLTEDDLLDYAKSEDVTKEIGTAVNDMATKTWVNGEGFLKEHQSLDEYAKSAEVTEEIGEAINGLNISQYETITGAAGKYQPKGEYLTEHQSLENYYNKGEVDQKVSDAVADKTTKTYVDGELAKKADATTLDNYALKTAAVGSIEYNSASKKIEFKAVDGTTTIKDLDATPFIKDGMVNEVKIANGTGDNNGKQVLLITFNTDATGKENIEIPLVDIFDPSNYMSKSEVEAELGKKLDKTTYETDKATFETKENAESTYLKIADSISISEIESLYQEAISK